MGVRLCTLAEIDAIAAGGRLAGLMVADALALCRPGVTTASIGDFVAQRLDDADASAILRGYRGKGDRPPFPASCCVCVGEEVVHAPPGPRVLREGDVVTVDLALALDGWCADAADSVFVGSPDPATGRLPGIARELVAAAIGSCGPGVLWSEVACRVRALAQDRGVRLVARYVGHGIGRALHEAPSLPLTVSQVELWMRECGDLVLRPGMVFTIEPIVTAGSGMTVELDDGWTVVTGDRLSAAHAERTVAIRRSGCEVLSPVDGPGGSEPLT